MSLSLSLGLRLGARLRPGVGVPAIVLPEGPLLGINFGLPASPSEVTDYETWLGRAVDVVNIHGGRQSKSDMATSLSFGAGKYAGLSHRRDWTTPLCVAAASGTNAEKIAANQAELAAAAAGDYNATYVAQAQAILANAMPSGDADPIIIRGGHEFNLGPLQQPWSIWGGKHADYVAAYRNQVNAFRSVSRRFKFCWCPNFEKYSDAAQGFDGLIVNPELAYPGDSYVDVIGMDFYEDSGSGFPTNPAAALAYYTTGGTYRLPWLVTFANAHGKLKSIEEWATQYDNHEVFISGCVGFFVANGFWKTAWWENTGGSYPSKLSLNELPETADSYRENLGVPPALYLGQVGTRCHLSKQTSATPKQMMLRTYHKARDAITAIRIAEANWYISNSTFAETGMGANMIVTAAIEYPLNVCTRLLWGGSTSGTIATNTTGISDALTISIPKGAWFAVRRYITCTAGIPFTSFNDTVDRGFGIDIMGYAASGITDQTMSNATVTSAQAAGVMHYPAAILGMTRKPSLAVIGDSINVGATGASTTAAFDGSGDLGTIQRSIAKSYGCLDLGIYGEKLQNFVASHARRVELAGYCSHIAIQMGINDVTGGRSAAQIQTDTETIAGYFTTQQMVVATLPPSATSSDSFATTANQTTHANNANRLTVNAYRRALPDYDIPCWEVADALESARDSGKWKAPGPYTTDGTHPLELGYGGVASSGAVKVSDLLRVAA